ncbi:hypothetical protein [Agromyces sp. NPDC058110]|uniref:hypothetical protein n=1 Tax=Agromyces sp. NPDC058110 TaxID=3346345 RepID=UPI0036DD359B
MSGALSDADDTGTNEPVEYERPQFDLRTRAIETVVLVASVVVLRALGVVLLVASSQIEGSIDILIPFVVMLFDLNLLVWIALTAAVQFGLRSMGRGGRWTLIVVAAPVAVMLAHAVRGIASLASSGLAGVLGDPVSWTDAGILTLIVVLGIAFTGALLGRERRTSARISGWLIAVSWLLVMLLLWEALAAGLSTWGSSRSLIPEQENLYVVTAVLTFGTVVAGFVFAAVSRRPALIIIACAVGLLGLVIAIAMPVPADRFDPKPPPATVDPGGGGGCLGDNCLGG